MIFSKFEVEDTIEDNPANLSLVEYIVSHVPNVKMFSAASGELGLDLAMAHNPELILLDINLPGIDGYEVLQIISQSILMSQD